MSKNKIICVRHLEDQNALKSYGLNAPLKAGQDEKAFFIARQIEKELEVENFHSVKIIYTNKTLRMEQTAQMLEKELAKYVKVSLYTDNRLDIFDQGEVLLPKGYKDGDYFSPLMQAWDVISDEAYIYGNIDYRFGDGQGVKKYPELAKAFLRSGESFVNLFIRKLSLIDSILEGNLAKRDELLVFIEQDFFILLLNEILAIVNNNLDLRPERFMFDCWDMYKNYLQNINTNDNTPFGGIVPFDLTRLMEDNVRDFLRQSREYLEDRVRTQPNSIQGKINMTSNDFTEIDLEFKKQTGTGIDSETIISKDFGFYPISVIIPYYNSRSTILYVLQSIELQNLTKEEIKNVEVVVVDDGWNDDIAEIALPENYSFELKVVSYKENGGRSHARNMGVKESKHDILMFLDADNLVSGECLREHSIRNKLEPNQLYTSLVANLSLEEVSKELTTYLDKNKPLPRPRVFNEYRIREKIDNNSVGIYKVKNDVVIEIMKETNNFRDYGFGRMVAYYDLPSMYATYCVSVTRTMFERIGGFSEEFKGWGMEDTFFGAVGIVNGAKIIPVLSCGSYSVNLPSHSGSEEKEREELEENIQRYNKLVRNAD